MAINLDHVTEQITVTDTAANADLTFVPKGTGVIAVVPSAGWVSGQIARINLGDAGSNIKSTASSGKLTLSGFDGVELSSRGASPILQFNVTHTASAVNYLQATGQPAGFGPLLSSQGSDTNINMVYLSKGSGGHGFGTNGGSFIQQFAVTHTASAVNYVQATGAATGSGPTISAQGSDTNIDLAFTPKGTGNVRFGTYTGTILTPTGYVEIKDSGGTVRRLLVG